MCNNVVYTNTRVDISYLAPFIVERQLKANTYQNSRMVEDENASAEVCLRTHEWIPNGHGDTVEKIQQLS